MDGGSGSIHRVLPGETLIDKVSLGTLTDIGGLATYAIMVERPDISSEMFCYEEFKNPALIRSNHITVTVMAAR